MHYTLHFNTLVLTICKPPQTSKICGFLMMSENIYKKGTLDSNGWVKVQNCKSISLANLVIGIKMF